MTLALKLGQVAGALLMAAGVTACTLKYERFALLFIVGGLVYGVCRLVAWLRAK